MATFHDLVNAIESNQDKLVEQYLLEYPELILEVDENENYITHIAARYGNKKTIRAIHDVIKEYGRIDLFSALNKQGNTPLHLAAGNNKSEEIEYLINIDLDAMRMNAKTINSMDYLPTHCARQNPNSEERVRIENLLTPLVLHQTIAPLAQLIDPQELLQRYNIAEKPELKENLEIACEIVNRVRKMILRSPTHPLITQVTEEQPFDEKKLSELHKQNRDIREKTKEMVKQISTEIKNERKKHKTELNIRAKAIIENKIGTCEEFAFLSLKYLTHIAPNKQGELFNILEGDHVFLVIGRDPKTDIKDFNTWNKNAVVCDAWSGEVFLASQINEKLKDHYKFNEKNIVAPINPKVHKLSLFFSIPSKTKEPIQNQSPRQKKL